MSTITSPARQSRRPLRRPTLILAVILVAALLFLNYRPRYPHTFSTRYGQAFPRQAMIDAICALRGEEVRGQLEFVETNDKGLDAWSEFRVPATGETFDVREATRQVRAWKLGQYWPQLGVQTAPTDVYHRAFMRRYYQLVPVERMRLIRLHVAHVARRGFEYEEVGEQGVLLCSNRCSFNWDKPRHRVETVYFGHEPLQIDPRPTITRWQAEQIAQRRARRTPGLISATMGQPLMARDPEFRDSPCWSVDGLGVQRCMYDMTLDKLKWRRWARPPSGCLCDEQPSDGVLWVDARTGAPATLILSAFWQMGVLRQQIMLETPAGNLWDVNYPAVRLWGQPYICGKYLQSYLWMGKYSFDRRSGVFSVEDQGKRWVGRRGSPILIGPEGLSMSWMPARMIDGELYLPTQMLTRITGWSFHGSWGWLTLQPPETPPLAS